MTSGRWDTLSSWHNAWLTADADERERLRAALGEQHPELVDAAERLIADGRPLEGFLETPALLVAASAMAQGEVAGRESPPPHPKRPWRVPLWIATTAALSAVAFGTGWQLGRPGSTSRSIAPLVRFGVPLPTGTQLLSAPAVSPDGERIVFAAGAGSASQLMMRELAVEGVTPIDGTEGAASPFWSPDGDWVGFSAHGRLVKVARRGGPPAIIEGAVGNWGGAWGRSGVVFQPAVRNAGLLRVPVAGGRAEQASNLEDGAGDSSHRFPVMLPDGRSFLYYTLSRDERRRGMHVARPGTAGAAPSARVGTVGCPATFVAVARQAGLMLWALGTHIEVRAFDPERLRVGDPRALDIPAAPSQAMAPALLSATADVLAYAAMSDDPLPREIGVVIGWRRMIRELTAAEWRRSPAGSSVCDAAHPGSL